MDHYQTSVDAFDRRAYDYMNRFMHMDLYHDTYDAFLKVISDDAKIFELGCGPGNITRYLLDRKPNLKINGTDLAPTMIELARKNNPEAEFMLLDARKIHQVEEKFDAVLSGFVTPYLSAEDCIKLIQDSANLLSEGGILYLSTIEGDPSRSGPETNSKGDTIFIHYHQEEALRQMMMLAGFEVKEVLRKKFQRDNGTFFHDIIFIAEKKRS